MSGSTRTTRVYCLGNPDKPNVQSALEDFLTFARPRCQLVGYTLGVDGRLAVEAHANRVVVLGGDGTLIGVARSLGNNQIPLIGVNAGKLGFLAEFSLEELKRNFDAALSDETLINRRMVLQILVKRGRETIDYGLAINDCVIQAGPPFRMSNLGVSIDGEHLTDVRGDGLIVCTPSGSTAHNLSAGGPIIQPGINAIVLTPLNPHSLTHKPLVIECEAVIDIHASTVNEGTTAIIDGQVSVALKPDDQVTIQRFPSDFMLVRNPRYAGWHKLVTKLHWGRPPNFD